MKKYLAYDSINGDYEEFETIKQARKYLEESFLDADEGYHPDADQCKIYVLTEVVKLTEVDKKSNYKYASEDDVPEDDESGDFWPHASGFDAVCEHKFISI